MQTTIDPNSWVIINYAYKLIGLIIAFTIHGFTKAFVSTKLGDELPTREGRVTLNPTKQLDIIGLIVGFIFGIGWGKTVNVSTGNYEDRKIGTILTNTIPMIVNFAVGFLFSILQLICVRSNASMYLIYFFETVALINIANAIFNLLPMKPLDGNELLKVFLPFEKSMQFTRYESTIQAIGMFLIMFGILPNIISFVANLILPRF